MTHLELVDLTKVYNEGQDDEVTAVENLDIGLDQGEFLVLVGPSGCGKSTVLRCIAGLEDVTSGEIRIDDVVVNDMTPEERDIAMVFQNYALYPHMTARENMSFGLKMTTNLSDEEIAERVDDVADMMGIGELLDDKPREMSGGQQQRVALGRAIVREPEVFLLDEPLSNLDAKLRTRMRTEIQQLQRELDVTTVYVTHDQTEAMTMGDRIAVLDDGELQQLGTPLECYHEPANRFVAGFIGEPAMNFFDVVREDDALVGDALSYPLDERLADVTGERFTLGIRPEDVHLADADGAHTYRVEVQVVEPMGDDNVVIMTLGDVEMTAEIDGSVGIEEGNTVRVELPPEFIHLFDARTGEAVVNRSFSETDVSTAVIE